MRVLPRATLEERDVEESLGVFDFAKNAQQRVGVNVQH